MKPKTLFKISLAGLLLLLPRSSSRHQDTMPNKASNNCAKPPTDPNGKQPKP